eukprot:CAMPEP_0178993370 /NCGR_PEP_ID=MMETSP0795-20121207/6666_1 /TAXON_ID=88552 /ORGANISM="Amoebophrya sp., Strain Ameob2" /LENGTH=794 /DNA_ID=CAMNT_0020685423 /DNA_START=233 /DNA_END=2617 /DNA_ORIENTATION=-
MGAEPGGVAPDARTPSAKARATPPLQTQFAPLVKSGGLSRNSFQAFRLCHASEKLPQLLKCLAELADCSFRGPRDQLLLATLAQRAATEREEILTSASAPRKASSAIAVLDAEQRRASKASKADREKLARLRESAVAEWRGRVRAVLASSRVEGQYEDEQQEDAVQVGQRWLLVLTVLAAHYDVYAAVGTYLRFHEDEAEADSVNAGGEQLDDDECVDPSAATGGPPSKDHGAREEEQAEIAAMLARYKESDGSFGGTRTATGDHDHEDLPDGSHPAARDEQLLETEGSANAVRRKLTRYNKKKHPFYALFVSKYASEEFLKLAADLHAMWEAGVLAQLDEESAETNKFHDFYAELCASEVRALDAFAQPDDVLEPALHRRVFFVGEGEGSVDTVHNSSPGEDLAVEDAAAVHVPLELVFLGAGGAANAAAVKTLERFGVCSDLVPGGNTPGECCDILAALAEGSSCLRDVLENSQRQGLVVFADFFADAAGSAVCSVPEEAQERVEAAMKTLSEDLSAEDFAESFLVMSLAGIADNAVVTNAGVSATDCICEYLVCRSLLAIGTSAETGLLLGRTPREVQNDPDGSAVELFRKCTGLNTFVLLDQHPGGASTTSTTSTTATTPDTCLKLKMSLYMFLAPNHAALKDAGSLAKIGKNVLKLPELDELAQEEYGEATFTSLCGNESAVELLPLKKQASSRLLRVGFSCRCVRPYVFIAGSKNPHEAGSGGIAHTVGAALAAGVVEAARDAAALQKSFVCTDFLPRVCVKALGFAASSCSESGGLHGKLVHHKGKV